MNKGLRNQILGYMPEKLDVFRQDAQEQAEAMFEECSKKIGKGDFTPITEHTIVLSASNIGTCEKSCLWRDFFDEKIAALFESEGIKLVKVERTLKIFGYIYLRI